MTEEKRFAVLIDSDNVSSKYIKYIMDEISNYGIVTYKRIYGDWTSTSSSSWKNVLLENSITPIQQYSYTVGKNATDSAMIIDAMDILYSSKVEGFCIVSSDSDFTRLAVRLRESGMMVIGMGEKKTPQPFRVACNIFKYLDILTEDTETEEEEITLNPSKSKSTEAVPADNRSQKDVADMTDLETIKQAMINIINENGDEARGIDMGELGNRILKRHPDFDVRNYGYTKLSKFLTTFDCFEQSEIKKSIYVYLKDNKANIDHVRKELLKYMQEKGEPEVNMSQLNQWLVSRFPQFSVKNYGYKNFSKFIGDIDGLKIKSSGANGCVKKVLLLK